jgi:capsular exopolysaccharide synthesis family protein
MEGSQQLRVIWGYRWWVLAFAVGAAATTGVSSSRTPPSYEAGALTQVVSGRQAGGDFVAQDELLHLTNIYAELARTRPVAERARREAALPISADELISRVSVEPKPELEVLEFRGRSSAARRAARYANAYASSFAAFVQEQQDNRQAAALATIQRRVRDLQDQLAADPLTAASVNAEIVALQTRAADEQVRPTDSIRLIQPARTPGSPTSPKPARDAVVAFFAALVLASGAAFARFTLTDRYGSAEEAATDLGLAMLGEVPRATRGDERAVEGFRVLRTNLEFSLRDRARPILLITGAEQGAGKTHVTENLARAFAAAGRRVVAVDADLRRPALHERLRVPLSPGLADILTADAADVPELLTNPVSHHGRLSSRGGDFDAVTAGTHLHDSAEALSSPRMAEALGALGGAYDVVVLDSPPVIAVVDAVVLARYADGVLFVIDSRRTRRRDARRALQVLRAIEAPILGLVFNSSRLGKGRYGYYDARTTAPVVEAGLPR